jgi:hypothetical protein
MTTKPTGMFIYDDEIRERYGVEADAIIARLDADPATQKDKATRPAGARYRPAVEKALAEPQR